jgi:meso-butanediol dehydrogenase/(S,S)-butanediol dehydrogenase/diacetyl reductase
VDRGERLNLKDRVVLITGAAGGLGRATALAFAQAEATPFIIDVKHEELEETRRLVAELGRPCIAHATDISTRAACFDSVARGVAEFGRLDVLCNVAAVVHFKPSVDVTEADWTRVMAVNFNAPFYFCQAAIPYLLKYAGNIVNVSSVVGQTGIAYSAAYAAAKAGLINMTRSLAMEYIKQPIRINAVVPGAMATAMNATDDVSAGIDLELIARFRPPRPVAGPERTADFIVYIASDLGKSFHGASLNIDDGMSL